MGVLLMGRCSGYTVDHMLLPYSASFSIFLFKEEDDDDEEDQSGGGERQPVEGKSEPEEGGGGGGEGEPMVVS